MKGNGTASQALLNKKPSNTIFTEYETKMLAHELSQKNWKFKEEEITKS